MKLMESEMEWTEMEYFYQNTHFIELFQLYYMVSMYNNMYIGAITDPHLEHERKVPILQADNTGCLTPCHLHGKHVCILCNLFNNVQ